MGLSQMNAFITLLQLILGHFFLVIGLRKIIGSRTVRDNYLKWRYPLWLMTVKGVLDLMGALGMLMSIFFPALASIAGAWLCLLALGALYTHLIRARNKVWVVSAVVFILSGVVVYQKVMALLIGLLLMATAPDPAPLDIVKATQVVSFEKDAPELFESIVIDREGNIYLSLGSKGQIRKIAPDGSKSTTFAVLPTGKFDLFNFKGILGALVMDPAGNLYATVVASDPENKGIWKITPDGQPLLWAKLPPESAPNGITIDGKGNLYVADSLLMLVWRVPQGSRTMEKWAVHELLGKTGNKYLPGPNGLKFWQGDLYVSVSNSRHVVKIPVQSDGSAGKPEIYIDGIPADDFAFDTQGNVYLTTHFNNTIIRVSPEGKRAIIATEEQGIVGPTAVAFGRLPHDRDKLFVINDGGFANPLAKGIPNVMRLDVNIPGIPIP
jgi:sugar lactone lactonase YvrE